jgi:importin subunit alpha-1
MTLLTSDVILMLMLIKLLNKVPNNKDSLLAMLSSVTKLISKLFNQYRLTKREYVLADLPHLASCLQTSTDPVVLH